VSRVLNTFLVILAVHDTIAAQLSAVLLLFTLVHISPPLLYNPKHETAAVHCAVLALVAESRMVEHAIDNAVDSAVYIDTWVVPAGNELRNYPFQDLRGNLASWLIENLQFVS